MRVLVACEYSGRVRDAFLALGHDAMSCDLLDTEVPGPHYQGDVRDVIDYPWDLMICHPPCTHLSVSGARHFEAKRQDGRQQAAVSFFMMLARQRHIPRIAIENPVCIMSSLWRKPDQTIQPWQFGHGETKATCLAQGAADANPNEHRGRARGTGPPFASRSGSLERAQPHVRRGGASDGRAVGMG